MSYVPSYLYSGLDSDTYKLSKELENLGGGDAKTEHVRVHGVFVNPSNQTDATILGRSRVLWDYGTSIGLKDVHMPDNAPAVDCMKYYPVSNTFHLENIISTAGEAFVDNQGQSYRQTGTKSIAIEQELKRVVAEVLQGFNHCILTIGERGIGKTLSLFGDESQSNLPREMRNHGTDNGYNPDTIGMSDRLLNYIFEGISRQEKARTSVALSAWIIRGQHTIDLCSPVNSGEVAMEFASIECPTKEIAKNVLFTARSKAVGVRSQMGKSISREQDRAHFFARVLVHSTHNGETWMSVLYIADTLGASSEDDVTYFDDSERFARRDINMQVQTLSKVLNEIKKFGKAHQSHANDDIDDQHPKLVLTSSRESKLTSLLGPILTGNCSISIYAYLAQSESHYNQNKSTLALIDGLSEVINAIYRVKNVPISALKLKSYETVLEPSTMPPNTDLMTYSQRSIADSISIPKVSKKTNQLANTRQYSILSSPMKYNDDIPNSQSLNNSYEESMQMYADMDLHRLASPDMILATPKRSSYDQPFDKYHDDRKISRSLMSNVPVNPTYESRNDNPSGQQSDRIEAPISRLVPLNDMSTIRPQYAAIDNLKGASNSSVGLSLIPESNVHRDDSFSDHPAAKGVVRDKSSSSASIQSDYNDLSFKNPKLENIMGEFHNLMAKVDGNSNLIAPPNKDTSHSMRTSDSTNHSGNNSIASSKRNPELGNAPNDIPMKSHLPSIPSSSATSRIEDHRPETASKSSRNNDPTMYDYMKWLGNHNIDSLNDNTSKHSRDAPIRDDPSGSFRDDPTKKQSNVKTASMPMKDSRSIDSSPITVDNDFNGEDDENSIASMDSLSEAGSIPLRPDPYASRETVTSLRPLPPKPAFFQTNNIQPNNRYDRSVRDNDNSIDSFLDSSNVAGIGGGLPLSHLPLPKAASSLSREEDPYRNSSNKGPINPLAEKDELRGESGTAPMRSSSQSLPLPSSWNPYKAVQSSLASKARDNTSNSSSISSAADMNKDPMRSSYQSNYSQQQQQAKDVEKDPNAMNELNRLRGVHASLLEALNHERDIKDKLQKQIDSFQEEILEMKTQYDVELSTLQVELKRSKAQLRSVCDNYSLTDVFTTFEENVSRLVKENKELRDNNFKLESKLLDIVLKQNGKNGMGRGGSNPTHASTSISRARPKPLSSPTSTGDDNDQTSDDGQSLSPKQIYDPTRDFDEPTQRDSPEIISAMDNAIKSKLRDKIKKLAHEKEELKNSCEELLKKERQFLLGQKLNEDISRRLRLLFSENEKLKKDLQQERLIHAEKDKDLNILRVEIQEIQSSDRTVRDDRARILMEVAQLRDRIKELEAEKKRVSQLNKFVSKHASDPDVIPSNADGTSSEKSRSASAGRRGPSPSFQTNQIASAFSNNWNSNKSLDRTNLQPSMSMIMPSTETRRLMKDMATPRTPLIGLAGIDGAEYIRHEEASSLHPELEAALSSMHENIISHSPKLLPIFKNLQQQIHSDRARNIIDKSKLIGKVNILQKKSNQRNSNMNDDRTSIPHKEERMWNPNVDPNASRIHRDMSNQIEPSPPEMNYLNDQTSAQSSRRNVNGNRSNDQRSSSANRASIKPSKPDGSMRNNSDAIRRINFESLKKRANL